MDRADAVNSPSRKLPLHEAKIEPGNRAAAMTYEILKRLRDSGFPLQPVPVETGREIVLLRQVVVFAGTADRAVPGIFYIPSLADLIEACGTELRNMCRVAAGWECNQILGATLDDALAELWLTQRATAG